MAPRITRAQAAKDSRAAQAEHNTTSDAAARIDSGMQQVIAALDAQRSGAGGIALDAKTIVSIDKICNECDQSGCHITRARLGELVRLIDEWKLAIWLAPDTHVAVLRILLAAEPDTYQTYGLKLLLQATQFLKLPGGKSPSLQGHKLPSGNIIRSLLAGFLQNRRTDGECHEIARNLYTEYADSIQMSTADSPIDVSASRGVTNNNSETPSRKAKRARTKFLDARENPYIFEIPPDDPEEVLVNSQSTRKPNVIKFGPTGPRNQARANLAKKRKPSSGGVTKEGSPIATKPGKRRKTFMDAHNPGRDTPVPTQRKIGLGLKKKDRLQDSTKKTDTSRPSPVGKTRKTPLKGQPTVIDLSDDVEPGDLNTRDQDLPRSPEPFATDGPVAAPRSTTLQISKAPQMTAGIGMINAEEQMFDLFTTVNDGAIVREHSLEASVFPSPARPQSAVNSEQSNEQPQDIAIDHGTGHISEQDHQRIMSPEQHEGHEEQPPADLLKGSSDVGLSDSQNDQGVVVLGPDLTNGKTQTDSPATATEYELLVEQIVAVNGQDLIEQYKNAAPFKTTINVEHKTAAASMPHQIHSIIGPTRLQIAPLMTCEKAAVDSQADQDQGRIPLARLTGINTASLFNPRDAEQKKHQETAAAHENVSAESLRSGSWGKNNNNSVLESTGLGIKRRVLYQTRSRGVQTDPDQTLVDTTMVIQHMEPHRFPEQSFGKSSTTTESHTSPPPESANQNKNQAIFDILQGLNSSSSSIIMPMISLLLYAAGPIINADKMVTRTLEHVHNLTLQNIVKVKSIMKAELDGRTSTILSNLEDELERIANLDNLCQCSFTKPSFSAPNTSNSALLQEAIASLTAS